MPAKRVNVKMHARTRPNDPSPPFVEVQAHTRSWPISAKWPKFAGGISNTTWHEIGAKPSLDMACFPINYKNLNGKICYWEKDDKMYGTVKVNAYGAKLLVTASVPMSLVREHLTSKIITMGWSPWKSIKKAGRGIAKGVSKVARNQVTKKLVDVVQHPAFTQMALPAGLAALGVPPSITTKAIGLVNNAKQKDPEAVAKIKNIVNLKDQGYQPAEKLWAIMSSYFRGGLQGVEALPAMMPQVPRVPQSPYYPYQVPRQPQMPYGMPQMPYGMPQMPPQMPYGLPYGMTQFQLPRFRGMPQISGWVYNVPYRQNIPAMQLDKSNPFHAMRHLYNMGAGKTPENFKLLEGVKKLLG